MALLIFSNTGDWERDNIGFRGVISTEQVINQGIIKCVQDFIRDDGILDEAFEDEHKGLDVKSTGDYTEFFELLDTGEYTLWSDYSDPTHFVNVVTSTGKWIYVIYKV